MKKEIIYNENLHFEHEHWKSELAFWEDELKMFKNRLSELVTRWTDKQVLVQLEHYQNQFILHGGIIEDLQETIEKHEIRMAGHGIKGRCTRYGSCKKTFGVQEQNGNSAANLCRP